MFISTLLKRRFRATSISRTNGLQGQHCVSKRQTNESCARRSMTGWGVSILRRKRAAALRNPSMAATSPYPRNISNGQQAGRWARPSGLVPCWVSRTLSRRTSRGGQILQKGRGKSASLKALYQLVPLARIPKRLRFYEDAAKVVQRRMVPNFKKSFERAVRTARR